MSFKKNLSIGGIILFMAFSSCCAKAKGSAESQSCPFRIMQFNILQGWDSCHKNETKGYEWEKRREAVAKMIEKRHPDIICIQEARKGQCAFLQKRFPEYRQVLYPKDGVITNGGQRNLIMYRTDKFKCVKKKVFWFSETPHKASFSWDATTPKLTLMAQLKPCKTVGKRKKFWVYCTHFFPRGDVGKQKCSDMILESMRKEVGEKAPVLFCGDLNLRYLDNRLDTLLTYLKDAAVTAEVTDGPEKITYNGFREKNQKALDHIYGRNVLFRTYKVDQSPDYGIRWVSDHYPLYADVEIE